MAGDSLQPPCPVGKAVRETQQCCEVSPGEAGGTDKVKGTSESGRGLTGPGARWLP